NIFTPVQTAATTSPSVPHDVAYYRDLAQAEGTYFAGSFDASDGSQLNGVIFAEDAIHLGSGITGTATLVSAQGEIKVDGPNDSLTAAVDGLVLYAAGDKITISGDTNVLGGSIFVPGFTLEYHGSYNVISGPIVARDVEWPGSYDQVGGTCCAQ